jgi:AGZA family xanthine/uracil permease-like MFS transporter
LFRNDPPQDIKDFKAGISFHSGDFVSLFSLFFDNLSTLLGFSGAILGLVVVSEDGTSNADVVEEILFRRIIPAAGVMLFVGNIYYTWQAIRMARKYDRPFTAQPYGLNTAGGFPFIFGE